MLSTKDLDFFSKPIADWYQLNKRDLPWRDTTNAYYIWLSEIILQQTRIAQGFDYFVRFVNNFPKVSDLAAAPEDEVLKLWQGLGYYSRARNLHATAKIIVEKYKGVFPTRYEDVLSLKGVGAYTAAAICSFAYNQPYAVVDGNVFRVISRVLGVETPIDSVRGKKEFEVLAAGLLNTQQPALHNQAMMEFGALQCTPQSPDCTICILQNSCWAFAHNKVGALPVKEKKTKVSTRFFNYFYFRTGQTTFLKKRVEADVWKNLYEFPLIETESQTEIATLMELPAFKKMTKDIGSLSFALSTALEVKHVLSHQIIYARFYVVDIQLEEKPVGAYIEVLMGELSRYPVSRLIEKFQKKALIL